MCRNRSTHCQTEYMKVAIHTPVYLCPESIRLNIWRSCVLYTILLLLYFEILFASTRSICGFYEGSEWLYSRNPMSYRWLSMTISRKRNKYAGDQVSLNKQIWRRRNHADRFSNKKIARAPEFLGSNYWSFVWSPPERKIHGSCQIASWIHIAFHSWGLCLSSAHASTKFVLLVVKLLCFKISSCY